MKTRILLLGLSGNTGWSSRPHLHFHIFKALDGRHWTTLPYKVKAREGAALVPQQGESFTAI